MVGIEGSFLRSVEEFDSPQMSFVLSVAPAFLDKYTEDTGSFVHGGWIAHEREMLPELSTLLEGRSEAHPYTTVSKITDISYKRGKLEIYCTAYDRHWSKYRGVPE